MADGRSQPTALASRRLGFAPEAIDDALCGIFFDNQDNERTQLGRALHDSTGQLLLTLSLNLAQIRAINHDNQLDGLIDEMSETVDRIHREIRDVAFLEYPAELSSSGLATALSAFVRGFAKRTGLAADFHCRDVGDVADDRIALALLRIGQEALVNAYRHAHPSTIHVTLVRNVGRLKLTITDDGGGMPVNDGGKIPHGLGLLVMRHRAEQLGGDFTVSRLNPGTKLVARIPTSL